MNVWIWFVAAAATALSAALFARLAPRVGWLDRATPETAHRKLQDRPIAPVGGAAILVGTLTLAALGTPEADLTIVVATLGLPSVVWSVWPAAGLAFVLGLVDDLLRRGLDWRLKLLGQASVAFVFVEPLIGAEGAGYGFPMVLAVVVVLAQNAWNTFDNADGVATSVGAVALAPVAPPLAAALLGFLPHNLKWGRGRAHACLGDAGSHLIGVMIVAHPAAWPALVLPLVDLARLSVVRLRAGSRPWIGDRRHLAHRLQRTGMGSLSVAVVLVLIALPATALGTQTGPSMVGIALTLFLYASALFMTSTAVLPSVATRQ